MKKILGIRNHNRIHYLHRTIERCSFYFDKIVVVDIDSDDGSREYLKLHPKVKLIEVRCSKQMTHLFDHILNECDNGDWLLSMDDDECPSELFLENMNNIITESLDGDFNCVNTPSIMVGNGYYSNFDYEKIVGSDNPEVFTKLNFLKYNKEFIRPHYENDPHGQILVDVSYLKQRYYPYPYWHFKTNQELMENTAYYGADWPTGYGVGKNDYHKISLLMDKYSFKNHHDIRRYFEKGNIGKDWKDLIIKWKDEIITLRSWFILYFKYLYPHEYEGDPNDINNEFSFSYSDGKRITEYKNRQSISNLIDRDFEIFNTYKFPENNPDLEISNDGWFYENHIDFFSKIENKKSINYILEIGSFVGKSTKFLLEEFPNSKIICIDHWEGDRNINPWFDVSNIYDQFISNLWNYKERVIPIKSNSVIGLLELFRSGICPELVYVDGGHFYKNLIVELNLINDFFPESTICGDDYFFPEVTMSMLEFSSINNIKYDIKDRIWYYNKDNKNHNECNNKICICVCNGPKNDVTIENFLYHYCRNLNSITKKIPVFIHCDGDDQHGNMYYDSEIIDICKKISIKYEFPIFASVTHRPRGHHNLMDDFLYRESKTNEFLRDGFEWVIFMDSDVFVLDQSWINDVLDIIDNNEEISSFGEFTRAYYENGSGGFDVANRIHTSFLGVRIEDFRQMNSTMKRLGEDNFKNRQLPENGRKVFCDSATFFFYDLLRYDKTFYDTGNLYDKDKGKMVHHGAITNRGDARHGNYDENLMNNLSRIDFFSTLGDVETELYEEHNFKRTVKLGAFYYIWYHGNYWFNQCARSKLKNVQKPTCGIYDSFDEDVIEKHIKWANSSGIDFFIVCVDKNSIETGEFREFLTKYKRVSNKFDVFPKISIQMETLTFFFDPINFSERDYSEIQEKSNFLVDLYDKDIWYKIDDKPFFMIYVSRQIKSGCEIFSKAIRDLFPFPIHLSGDEVWHGDMRVENNHCFDSLYPYNLYLHETVIEGFDNKDGKTGIEYIRETNKALGKYYEFCKSNNKMLIPNVKPRYNDRGVRPSKQHYVIPEENGKFFRDYLEDSFQYCIGNHLLVTSFNEWYEDTQIEPIGDSSNYGQVETENSSEEFDYTQGVPHRVYGEDFLNILREFKDNPLEKREITSVPVPSKKDEIIKNDSLEMFDDKEVYINGLLEKSSYKNKNENIICRFCSDFNNLSEDIDKNFSCDVLAYDLSTKEDNICLKKLKKIHPKYVIFLNKEFETEEVVEFFHNNGVKTIAVSNINDAIDNPILIFLLVVLKSSVKKVTLSGFSFDEDGEIEFLRKIIGEYPDKILLDDHLNDLVEF